MTGGSQDTGSRQVLVVAHTGREDVARIAEKLAAELAVHGVTLIGEETERTELGLSLAGALDPGNPPELVVALGGDGTLLRAAEAARRWGAPVIGINLGRVGFLAEADEDHLPLVVEAIADRTYLEPGGAAQRMTVDVTVELDGEILHTGWALNEASIEKANRETILDVVVEVDGRGVSAFGCDGILCATPTGSTAYAFSAGGPIMWPDVEALLLVPSNAHALFARAMVVGPDSTVSILMDPEGHEAVLICDGRRSVTLPPGSKVRLRRGERPVTLARLGSQPFSDRLARKFQLPVTGWRHRRR